jgi:predicted permease
MPDWKNLVRRRLPWAGREPDEDVLEELAIHLQECYEELRGGGLSDNEAVDAALNELESDGDVGALRRRRRQVPPAPATPLPVGGGGLASVWQDVRYGARLLMRAPAFTATVILTLAVGIAANTTAFTIINSVLLNSFPVRNESELVSVHTRDTADPSNTNTLLPLSYLNLTDIRERNSVFGNFAGHSRPFGVTLTNGPRPERVFAELVTGNYFETLGVKPLIGRFFLPQEDRTPGGHPVLVLGYAPWQGRFGGRPDIVGQTIRINGIAFTVTGVAPEGFKGLNAVFGPDIWIPSMMTEQVVPVQMRNWLTDRSALGFRATGRLRPGITVAQAQANLGAIATSLARENPDANRRRDIGAVTLSRSALQGMSAQFAIVGSLALMAVPGLVLLIACSNVANLLMARATARRQEIAVRMALGAGRVRVVRQLLTESALLGAISGAVGFALAVAGARLLWSFRPPEFAQNLVDLDLDLNIVMFAVGLSAITSLIFGAAPALQVSRSNLVTALTDETRTAGQHRRLVSLRHALLVGQVALSLTALMTAGLFLRSMQRAYAIDPGFEREHLGIIMLSPGQAGYDRTRAEQLYRDVRERVAALPGVTSASWATNLPLFTGPSRRIRIQGQTDDSESSGVLTVANSVDRDYFQTAGIAIMGGRDFTAADGETSVPVAIVNETLARKYWPRGDAIGQQLSLAGDPRPRQIVGIAKTANYQRLGEEPQPCVYLPLAQNFSDAVVLYVRASRDPAPVLAVVQRDLRQMDERLDVSDARTARKIVEQALFGPTMGAGLLSTFGLLALGLASLGMYGVMAYSVTLRRRELGVRMALGADRNAVLGLVLRQGLTLVGIGLVLGTIVAVGLSTALSGLLYGVRPLDPISFAAAAAILLSVAALACYLPARRASRFDPLTALRVK